MRSLTLRRENFKGWKSRKEVVRLLAEKERSLLRIRKWKKKLGKKNKKFLFFLELEQTREEEAIEAAVCSFGPNCPLSARSMEEEVARRYRWIQQQFQNIKEDLSRKRKRGGDPKKKRASKRGWARKGKKDRNPPPLSSFLPPPNSNLPSQPFLHPLAAKFQYLLPANLDQTSTPFSALSSATLPPLLSSVEGARELELGEISSPTSPPSPPPSQKTVRSLSFQTKKRKRSPSPSPSLSNPTFQLPAHIEKKFRPSFERDFFQESPPLHSPPPPHSPFSNLRQYTSSFSSPQWERPEPTSYPLPPSADNLYSLSRFRDRRLSSRDPFQNWQ